MNEIIEFESSNFAAKYFSQLVHYAWYLDVYDFKVYATILRVAGSNRKGTCFMSISKLAKMSRMSVNKARASKVNLINYGLITESSTKGGAHKTNKIAIIDIMRENVATVEKFRAMGDEWFDNMIDSYEMGLEQVGPGNRPKTLHEKNTPRDGALKNTPSDDKTLHEKCKNPPCHEQNTPRDGGKEYIVRINKKNNKKEYVETSKSEALDEGFEKLSKENTQKPVSRKTDPKAAKKNLCAKAEELFGYYTKYGKHKEPPTDEMVPYFMAIKYREMINKRDDIIKKINPNLSKWANTIRLMQTSDKLSAHKIYELMEFSQFDEFWRNNILCPSKLRKQANILNSKIQSEYRGMQFKDGELLDREGNHIHERVENF